MTSKQASPTKILPTGVWKLEKYGMHENGKWTEVLADHHLLFLTFKNMCLTLQHGQILVEHISLLTENVRMIRKRDSLGIVIVKENIKTKKLRMKFAGSGIYPGSRIIKQFENMLKPFVRVEDLTPESLSEVSTLMTKSKCDCNDMKNPWSVATSTKHARQTKKQKESSPEQPSEFVPLSKYVADLLNKRITDFYEDNRDLSSLYPLKDIIDACILDPDFPSFVAEVNNILIDKLKR